MKYTIETTIDLPLEEVIRKMDNVDNMKHWQRGLYGVEHISGTPGEVGAKMRLKYKFGKREMELVETITTSNFPKEFHATYQSGSMINHQNNFFRQTAEGQTKWRSECEFKSGKLGMRLMMFLMPGAFKKQSFKYMTDFKNFAERGTSVSEN